MIVNKPYTNKEYADLAVYCNDNDCHIEDKGDYLESVPNEHHAPTEEEQRQKRQQAFAEEADPLKYDYEEACARYGIDSDEAQDAKVIWLQKKDEIRERYPYPVEE